MKGLVACTKMKYSSSGKGFFDKYSSTTDSVEEVSCALSALLSYTSIFENEKPITASMIAFESVPTTIFETESAFCKADITQ